jgi:SAM-dependent methyltransferase
MAASNTHPVAFSMITKDKTARILDMPCGAGAMAGRLIAAGFSDVTCADIDESSFALDGVRFVKVDLRRSTPFPDGSLDVVICIECIEHLENPFHLVRELARILAQGGEVIISTPNVLSTNARSKFLSAGYFPHFSDLAFRWDYNISLGFQAHIMPVPFCWLQYMAFLNGLELVELGTNRYARRPRLKDRLIGQIVKRVSRRFFPAEHYEVVTSDVVLYGDILVARFVKSRALESLKSGGINGEHDVLF